MPANLSANDVAVIIHLFACSYSVHIDVMGSTSSLVKISLVAKKKTQQTVQDRRR